MAQLTLFESSDALVIDGDGDRGRVTYTPRFVETDLAERWFHEIRGAVPWRSVQRRMYDRDVQVPRLVSGFRLDEDDHPPAAILDAARRIADRLGVPFNSVGLNLYRDGRDSVAPHNDHLYEIREGFPIALLSLGAARRMTIRAKEPPRRAV